MKKALCAIILVLLAANTAAFGQFFNSPSHSSAYSTPDASITFKNESAYTMTLKIVYAVGGYYSTVALRPWSSQVVRFSKSASFKLKIKATSSLGHTSYHDGGKFAVTRNSQEWTEGEMSFRLSSHGNGLGPSISAKQFESNN